MAKLVNSRRLAVAIMRLGYASMQWPKDVIGI